MKAFFLDYQPLDTKLQDVLLYVSPRKPHSHDQFRLMNHEKRFFKNKLHEGVGNSRELATRLRTSKRSHLKVWKKTLNFVGVIPDTLGIECNGVLSSGA